MVLESRRGVLGGKVCAGAGRGSGPGWVVGVVVRRLKNARMLWFCAGGTAFCFLRGFWWS
jgi:hypothetical protein